MSTPPLPRRVYINMLVPAELAIREAVRLVEELGADVKLTDAVLLLQQARDKVSDFVDRK